ncbi:GNAT family N-acetyltransferase [Sporosarcina sp. ITBMC105]
MIVELQKDEFKKCRNLVNDNGQIEAIAVVESFNPGRIFVDDRNHPLTGLIWLGNNDGFIFFGDEQNEKFIREINGFIDSVIIPEAKKVQLKWFEGVGNHDRWNEMIKHVFDHRQLGSWVQRVYTLKRSDYYLHSEPVINEDYDVIKIETNLFKDDLIKNIDFLKGKLLEFWTSIENFLDCGIGYCIIHRNEVVSICFSGFVVGNVHCINIETLKPHQGKKLAQLVAHHFVNDCLKNNAVPYWDCMEMNKPSVAVAENIGFKKVFEYVGYEFLLE